MTDQGLSPQTIHTYAKTVKMVVASAVSEEGEELYPRKWNNEFIDMPEIRDQRTPSFVGEDLTQIVASAKGQFRLLYALLGGIGLRIAEAAGLEIQDVSPDASTVRIRQSVWNGQKQAPKTHSALREVDLCPSLAAMLKEFIGEREDGLLFQTKNGKPLLQSNILGRSLHPVLTNDEANKVGFSLLSQIPRHPFAEESCSRRLAPLLDRTRWQERHRGYSMVKGDVPFRQLCAANVGLGFELPVTNSCDIPEVAPSCTHSELLSSVA